MSLSTHVLDTARGAPVAGVPVRLDRADGAAWVRVAAAVTDGDGRVRDWVADEAWQAGTYRLVFDTSGRSPFFPQVQVVFVVAAADQHYHVPLLLSPYGYTTYRGS